MGTFVKLVVVDDREYDDSEWNICCGAGVTDIRTESFVGDDQEAVPGPVITSMDDAGADRLLERIDAQNAAHRKWEERHFPNCNDMSVHGYEREISRPYLASLVLGISGLSWYDPEADENWRCTKNDLTAEGLALYEQLSKLYPGCTLHLLTFVDT